MTTRSLKEHLQDGPFTLALSSGFFGFYLHAGLLTALLDAGLVPARVTGSSAGAMVAGAYAAGVPMDKMRAHLEAVRREHFWDPSVGFGLLRGRLYRALLDDILGDVHAHATPTPCAISVWHITGFRTVVVNEGPLAAAVHASSALPVLFQPVRVNGAWCTDGGVRDRPALASIKPGERVLLSHLTEKAAFRAGELRAREGVTAIALDRMPRPDPYAMHKGIEAYDEAAKRMRVLLDQPHEPVIVG
jgi:NTE family protein